MEAPKKDGTETPSTFFAPAERADAQQLSEAIAAASDSPVVSAILQSLGGAVVVLNPQRQIIAVNDSYLTMMGVQNPYDVLGLRPGEAARCIHLDSAPGGCGTGKTCRCCGMAIALLTSQKQNRPVEAECVLSEVPGGPKTDMDLAVRAVPITIEELPFVMVVMRDISAEKRRSALENAFLHDLANVVHGLQSTGELLGEAPPEEVPELARDVKLLSVRLAREVEIQRALAAENGASAFRVSTTKLTVGQVITELKHIFAYHPVARGKLLHIVENEKVDELQFESDMVLLQRVLTNLLLNALEATAPDGQVKFWVEQGEDNLTFSVWNEQPISEELAPRIFQRYFSTKKGPSRGQGTYAVRLLGERYLKGKVGFSSSKETGTTFELQLPKKLP